MKCPNCNLVNPDSAIRCACGHEFTKDVESNSANKPTRTKILSVLGTVVVSMGTVIVGVVGKECGSKLFQQFSHEETFTSSTDSWARREIPDLGVSIDLPGEPSPMEITLPPQAKGIIRSHKSYEYDKGGLTIAVSHMVYAGHITANPEGGAKGSFENLRGLEGVTNLQYSLIPQGKDRVSGNGSLSRFGHVMDVSSLVIARGNEAWIVMGLYERRNTNAAIASKRILDSLLVKPLDNGSR